MARTADVSDKREKLLRAAIIEFSSKGLRGARTEEIAKRANVNKQLIHHYFGSKDGLYTAALEEAYLAPRRQDSTLKTDHLAPIDALHAFIDHISTTNLRHLQMQMLITDENIHRGRHLKDLAKVKEVYSSLIERLDKILQRGIESGVFRDNLDTRKIYVCIVGLLGMHISNAYTMSSLLDIDLTTPEGQKKSHDDAVRILLQGILTPD